jgi:hypothetical protein
VFAVQVNRCGTNVVAPRRNIRAQRNQRHKLADLANGRLVALAMETVLGLTEKQKQIATDLRNVADEMRDLGNPLGLGLT